MIVITTPTGDIGHQLVEKLLASNRHLLLDTLRRAQGV